MASFGRVNPGDPPLHRLLSQVRGVIRADAARRDRDRPSPPGAAPSAAPHESPIRDTVTSSRRLPDADVSQLEAEARYHRDRLALYRARPHGGKPTTQGRLRELERTSAAADTRLRHARRP